MKKNFYGYQKQFFELYFQNKIGEALEKAEEIDELFPDKAYRTKYWKACLYGVLGKNDSALTALDELRKSGQWLSPQLLSKEEDLKGIWYNPRFEDLMDVFTDRKIEAVENSRPLRLEFAPTKPSERFIVALHWRMGNAEEFSRYWKNPAKRMNMRLLTIQSSQIMGTGMYCWDNMKLGKEEVNSGVASYIEGQKLLEENMILAGASQGGSLAFELVLEKKLKPGMLILVVPAFKNAESYTDRIKDLPNDFSVRIITGGKDHFYKETAKLNRILTGSGIDSELKVYKTMGHSFPEDFGIYLKEIFSD